MQSPWLGRSGQAIDTSLWILHMSLQASTDHQNSSQTTSRTERHCTRGACGLHVRLTGTGVHGFCRCIWRSWEPTIARRNRSVETHLRKKKERVYEGARTMPARDATARGRTPLGLAGRELPRAAVPCRGGPSLLACCCTPRQPADCTTSVLDDLYLKIRPTSPNFGPLERDASPSPTKLSRL